MRLWLGPVITPSRQGGSDDLKFEGSSRSLNGEKEGFPWEF